MVLETTPNRLVKEKVANAWKLINFVNIVINIPYIRKQNRALEDEGMKFLKSVKDEMKQVTWPNRKQLRKDSLIVIETSIIFVVMFFIMDTAIQSLFSLVLK